MITTLISCGSRSGRGWNGFRTGMLAVLAGCIQLASSSTQAAVELDTTFPVGTGPDGPIRNLVPDGSGGWWVTGPFTTWDEEASVNVTRLDRNGDISSGFTGLNYPGNSLGTLPHLAVARPDGTFVRLDKESMFRFRLVSYTGEGIALETAPGSRRPGGADLVASSIHDLALLDKNRLLVACDRIVRTTPTSGVPRHYLQVLDERLWVDETHPLNGILFLEKPDDSLNQPAWTVRTLWVEPAGSVIVGGRFAQVNGQPQNGLVRILPSGELDADFDPAAELELAPTDTELIDRSIVVHATGDDEGRLLVAWQTQSSDTAHLARLLPDGSLDSAFSRLDLQRGRDPSENVISSVLVQPDGTLLIAGSFVSVNDSARDGLARLSIDGVLDETFHPQLAGPDNGELPAAVWKVALGADGYVIIGGEFSSIDEVPVNNLARVRTHEPMVRAPQIIETRQGGRIAEGDSVTLWARVHADPSVTYSWMKDSNGFGEFMDPYLTLNAVNGDANGTYQLIAMTGEGVSSSDPISIEVLPRSMPAAQIQSVVDESFPALSLITQVVSRKVRPGVLAAVNETLNSRILAVLPDGSIDPEFASVPTHGFIDSLLVDSQGRCLVPHKSTSIEVQGVIPPGLFRILPDGTLDPSFNLPVFDPPIVKSMAFDSQGRILVAGTFQSVNDVSVMGEPYLGNDSRYRVIRLLDTGEFDPSFVPVNIDGGAVLGMVVDAMDRVYIPNALMPHNPLHPTTRSVIRVGPTGQIDDDFASADVLLEGGQIVHHPLGILVLGSSIQLLRPDDSIDERFHRWNPGTASFPHPNSRLIPFPDGSVMILSDFSTFDARSTPGSGGSGSRGLRLYTLAIARPDGDWDQAVQFHPERDNWSGEIFAGAHDGAGGLWLGGRHFKSAEGEALSPLVRIEYPHQPKVRWIEHEHGRSLEFDTWVGRTYWIETDVDGSGTWEVVEIVQGDGLVWRLPLDESADVALYRVRIAYE